MQLTRYHASSALPLRLSRCSVTGGMNNDSLACAVVLDEMVDTLEAMAIMVETYHAEAGNGQFEIVTHYADALQVHWCASLAMLSVSAAIWSSIMCIAFAASSSPLCFVLARTWLGQLR